MARRLWIVLRLEEVGTRQSSPASMILKYPPIARVQPLQGEALRTGIMSLKGFIEIPERRPLFVLAKMRTRVREVKAK